MGLSLAAAGMLAAAAAALQTPRGLHLASMAAKALQCSARGWKASRASETRDSPLLLVNCIPCGYVSPWMQSPLPS
eukprot:663374-Pleurochrysis_carterae.AAC.6